MPRPVDGNWVTDVGSRIGLGVWQAGATRERIKRDDRRRSAVPDYRLRRICVLFPVCLDLGYHEPGIIDRLHGVYVISRGKGQNGRHAVCPYHRDCVHSGPTHATRHLSLVVNWRSCPRTNDRIPVIRNSRRQRQNGGCPLRRHRTRPQCESQTKACVTIDPRHRALPVLCRRNAYQPLAANRISRKKCSSIQMALESEKGGHEISPYFAYSYVGL